MRTADRAFAVLMLAAAGTTAVLGLPLAITLFPGRFQGALQGYDWLVQTCSAALRHAGISLPPLGLPVLALTALAVAWALVRTVRILRRTERLAACRSETPLPPLVIAAARRVGAYGQVACFAHPQPIAYTAGLLRPRIWVSSGLCERLTGPALEAVLWHEHAHVLARDPLRVLIARALAALLFVVPWIAALVERYEVAKELEADRVALERLGSPAPLAQALYAIGDRLEDPRALAVGAWSLSARRIDQLYGTPAGRLLPLPSRGAVLLSVATVLLALGLAAGQAARANVVPVALLELIAAPGADAVQVCPVPPDGVLL